MLIVELLTGDCFSDVLSVIRSQVLIFVADDLR